jgi:hypothetical protein
VKPARDGLICRPRHLATVSVKGGGHAAQASIAAAPAIKPIEVMARSASVFQMQMVMI